MTSPDPTTSLITSALRVGVLKFGSFTLKSGRQSPYFFNASLLSTGELLHEIASAYARVLIDMFPRGEITGPAAGGAPPDADDADAGFDILFGPAYKGIPLAACTSLILSTPPHNLPHIGLAYDRKEAKTHGEGGRLVGVGVRGKRVVVVDDVMTAGTAVRGVVEMVRREGGVVVGVVLCLDREEVGGGDGGEGGERRSTVQELEDVVGKGRVRSILKAGQFLEWLEKNGTEEEVRSMREYREKYGVRSEL